MYRLDELRWLHLLGAALPLLDDSDLRSIARTTGYPLDRRKLNDEIQRALRREEGPEGVL